MFRLHHLCVALLVLILSALPATAAAKRLSLGVANGVSMKLKHPQHARFQVPDSAIVTPVLGDRKARLQKGVDLSRGSCHLDFTAKATYEHTISGGTFKRRARLQPRGGG